MEIGFFTLKQFVPLASFKSELMPLLGDTDYEVMQFYVPTEVVVNSPEMVIPRVARAFRTQFYHYKEGCLREFTELMQCVHASGVEFTTMDAYPSAWLVEVWSDRGDDGHIDYRHIGYRLVLADALAEKYSYDNLPLLMHDDKECQRYR